MYLKLTEKSKEPTLAERFQENISIFVVEELLKRDLDSEEVFPLVADLPVDLGHFNPLEHWQFRHIFSYESISDFASSLNKKHNCLFGRSAFRLYLDMNGCEVEVAPSDSLFSGYDGFELWLLDDMTIVCVGIQKVEIQTEEGTMTTFYRYPCELSQFNFDLTDFLQEELYDLFFETFEDEILGEVDFPTED